MTRGGAALRTMAFTGALAVLAGCGLLIGDAPVRVVPADSGSCPTTSSGQASLRIADFVPTTHLLDVCLTRTDGVSPLDGVPAIASQGNGYPGGIGYEQVLAPIALPAGAYDVQLQPAGAGCGGPALAMASICAGGPLPVTLALLGGGSGQTTVVALAESASPAQGAGLRFVNAVADGGNVDFGRGDQPSLPADVTPIFVSVPFGATSPAGTSSDGPIDDNGYVVTTPQPNASPLAMAPTGVSAATLVTTQLLVAGHRYTVTATGTVADQRFPQELYACDESQTQGAFTACGPMPETFTVDSIDAALYSSAAIAGSERKSALFAKVTGLPSDVACVTNVVFDADKRALRDAAFESAGFIYALWYPDTTLDTSFSDPTDQQGNVPSPPSTPACADPGAASGLSALLSCLEANCSTIPNDPTGMLLDNSSCFSPCGLSAEALLKSAPACSNCAVANLASAESFADTQTACTTDPRPQMVGKGSSGTLLLSRFPIEDGRHWVLPSTGTRADIVGATIVLSSGTRVDVDCVRTTNPLDSDLLPYTGLYGGGQTGAAGWEAELLLQTHKIVQYEQPRLTKPRHRMVIGGQWYAGPGVTGTLAPRYEDCFDVLKAVLPLAVPSGYAPQCTSCADNPLVMPSSTASTWTNYAVVGNIPVTDVTSASIFLREPTVQYDGSLVPVSPVYGFESVIQIRP